MILSQVPTYKSSKMLKQNRIPGKTHARGTSERLTKILPRKSESQGTTTTMVAVALVTVADFDRQPPRSRPCPRVRRDGNRYHRIMYPRYPPPAKTEVDESGKRGRLDSAEPRAAHSFFAALLAPDQSKSNARFRLMNAHISTERINHLFFFFSV